MASNYFDRTRGLHPTPSACIPPKPHKKTGNISAYVTASLWLLVPGIQITYNVFGCNDLFAPESPVITAYDLPGITQTLFGPTVNCNQSQQLGNAEALFGPHVGSVTFTWPNGDWTQRFIFYVITPI